VSTSSTPGSGRALRGRARVNLPYLRLALFGASLFVALLFVLTFQFVPNRYQVSEGDVSPFTIKAPQKVTYTSQLRTREERARAGAAVAEIYVMDTAVVDTQRQHLGDVLRQIGDIRRLTGTFDARREALARLAEVELRPPMVDDILAFGDAEWLGVANDAQRVYDIVERGRVTPRQVDEVRSGLSAFVNPILSEKQAAVVAALVSSVVRPNYVLDQEATDRARREAQDRVQPVRATIEKGETILRDGDVVRAVDLEKLEAAGLRNPTVEWRSIGASALLVALLVGALCLFLHHFYAGLARQGRPLLLLWLVIAPTVLTMKLIVPSAASWASLLPLAAPVMLVASLLAADLAIVVSLVLALSLGLIAGGSFEMAVVGLAGGLAGAMMARRFERLNTFFLGGAVIAAATFAASAAFALLGGDADPQRFALLGLMALINGALSGALTLGTLAAIGHILGFTTTLGLLELAHPTQPLFRRLLTEAPGTYHHSVVIANLAERAAEAIGADPLLCRVGAYYHDIGKIVRPYAFIENQAGENIHDRLEPATSARMIAAHVPDGLELARRYRLPDRVRDLIAQHHGTTFVGSFYRRAVQEAGSLAVDQAGFRYPGPKPQTREAAILMLADGVEATTRSSRDHSPEVVEGIVRRVIADRLAEGQLDECDLTFRDLDAIRNVFLTILRGMYHPRITYAEGTAPPAEERPAAAVAGERA
jgi:putative nucleotidyltransferase with HDIG domain